jgi:hypothetical protein
MRIRLAQNWVKIKVALVAMSMDALLRLEQQLQQLVQGLRGAGAAKT